MWRSRLVVRRPQCRLFHRARARCQAISVIDIDDATFFRQYPSATDTPETNPPFFENLSFRLPTKLDDDGKPQYWAVLSPSSLARTTFLQILAAQHICIPPTARHYPLLSELSISEQHAIKYVGFDAERGSTVGGANVRGAYLSARYESRREETDYSLHDYLTGHTELNALEHEQTEAEKEKLSEVIDQLDLHKLLSMPVANLSNGQTRRARIAKSLVSFPEVLLLDGPFMGLDPNTARVMGSVLRGLAERQAPRLVLSLRPEDGVPDWVSHLVVADEHLKVLAQGEKDKIFSDARSQFFIMSPLQKILQYSRSRTLSAVAQPAWPERPWKLSIDGFKRDSPALEPGEAVVEMQGVKVSYGDKTVLGGWKQDIDGECREGLWWSLHRGQRYGIFGPNGSGKTTMLSLVTSDHPQTYGLPIKLFGRSRLPGPGEPGISVFDLQRRMGHSSPEVHSFFPKALTVRRALESAWSDAPLARAKLSAETDRRVNAFLRWFAKELNPNYGSKTFLESLEDTLDVKRGLSAARKAAAQKFYDENFYDDSDLTWADDVRFRELSFSSQRLLLFLRAIVASPDLVILDEALSGIDERIRDKVLLFLSQGEEVAAVLGSFAQPSSLSVMGKVSFEGLTPDQALLVISHSKEDVPGCLREWICLPEPGEGRAPRTGKLPGPLSLHPQEWTEGIWAQQGS
ncbi:ABC transporter domain-containing protein [Pseudocercospora fijiensis CIRAD86]|uniref:ABC transporter domain-containing protein n=1 Tax=Pseudocercospora fijiensis (strain CIRAD86) TaxID=383855 RepID=M2YMI6_PSEFD|nr:ABC transporter domain-containing protein [Pseudocercospora fijiensis CIRAD86]EME78960.1 ABC transporter domain-containing protein [Pseudocercospora fijiensis CIRAD86]